MDLITLLIVIVLIGVLAWVINPKIFKEPFDSTYGYDPVLKAAMENSGFVAVPSRVDPPWAQDGSSGDEMNIGFNMCSKDCCGKQYPIPFPSGADPYLCQSEQVFTSNPGINCNNGVQDSGCLCMTDEQVRFMYRRGNNA